MIIGSEPMARTASAEWILMLAAPPDRARALAANLASANAYSPPVSFWVSVVRTTVLSAVQEIRTSPRRMAALVLAAYIAGMALGTAFTVVPDWLLRRPQDGSVLSAPLIRDAAQACASLFGLWVWRNLFGPLLLGLCVAWISRGRELLSLVAVMVSQFIAAIAVPMYSAHLGFLGIAAVVIDSPWNYLMVLLGAILVRRSFLWKKR